MKERPMLFNGDIVRALLDGSKVQTRRVMKPQPEPIPGEPDKYWWPSNAAQSMMRVDTFQRHPGIFDDTCPYGQPGDQIWVRETFVAFGRWETRFSAKKKRDEWHFVDMTLDCGLQYRFEGADLSKKRYAGAMPAWCTRPSIFMPRATSRILLEIVSVRVERLQDISDADIIAEGIDMEALAEAQERYDIVCKGSGADGRATERTVWRDLWESTGGDWGANPWCWAITFKRVTP